MNAAEVRFSFQGTDYVIDLGKKNLAAFEKALKPYIGAATKVSTGSGKSRRTSKSSSTGQNRAAVREWAKSAGIDVSSRGRIPNAVLEQYQAARNK